MKQPLVTVVLPIYNVEPYLNRSVSSVTSQTYRNLEIILVDDGATDNCPQMCDALAEQDCRIKVIHKQNAGLGMARNTGIDNATGEYIFFFDSDDYVELTIVEKCVAQALKHYADTIIYGRNDVHPDGEIVPNSIHPFQHIYIGDQIKNMLLPAMFTYDMGFGVSAWGKMYRLSCLKEKNIRFLSEREIISEDAFFALSFYPNIHTVAFVEENLYYYCKRENSLTHTFKPDRQIKNDLFLQRSLTYIKENNLPHAIIAPLTARYHFYTIGAMKQTYVADIDKKTKKQALFAIYRNQYFRSTLRRAVLKQESLSLRIFFAFLKMKLYPLCSVMLKCKA